MLLDEEKPNSVKIVYQIVETPIVTIMQHTPSGTHKSNIHGLVLRKFDSSRTPEKLFPSASL